jgi:geranylgeranyl reductase family protein
MMSKREAQVIVVGAGPAGSIVALELARRGRDVLILERARFPRDKPCGDCVNPGAVMELEELGLREALRRRLMPHSLRGWRIEAPDGRFFQQEFGVGRVGWAVRRRELDAALLDAARDAGARARFAMRVSGVMCENGRAVGVAVREGAAFRELRADFVVGADGLGSVVQRRLGLAARRPRLRKVALVGHLAAANGSSEMGELRVRGGRTCGYAPLTVGGNLTLVVPATEAGDIKGNARAFLLSALADFPAVQVRVEQAGLDDHVMVIGPFDRPVLRPWAPGAVLVGDAAGYYDPFTGQGIYQALRSARLAAAAIDSALGQPASAAAVLSRYGRALRRELAPTRVLQRVVEAAIRRPAIMSRFVRGLAATDEVAAALLQATGDLAHPATLLHPRVWLRLLPPMMLDGR